MLFTVVLKITQINLTVLIRMVSSYDNSLSKIFEVCMTKVQLRAFKSVTLSLGLIFNHCQVRDALGCIMLLLTLKLKHNFGQMT